MIGLPTKIIKLNSNIFSNFIYRNCGYCIEKGEFPNELQDTGIAPLYKNEKM